MQAARDNTKPFKNAQTKRSLVKQEEKKPFSEKSFSDQGPNELAPKTSPKSILPPWAGMRDFGRPKKFVPNYHPKSAPTVLGPRAFSDRIVKEPRIHSSPLTPVKIRGKRSSKSPAPSPNRKSV